MRKNKSYSRLIELSTYEERLEYLFLGGKVGEFTFNGHRVLNQMLYKCPDWLHVREKAAIRDNGFDLGLDGYVITGSIYVHHINPITIDDILDRNPIVFDLENLISCSKKTHSQIHYGLQKMEPKIVTERKIYDTCPWR